MKTKVYINLNNFNDEWLCATGELPAVVPFLTEEQQHKYLNRDDTPDSRKPVFMNLLEYAKNHIELTSIEDCDFVVLPFKYGHSDATPYIQEAKDAKKKIMVIFNDDSSEDLPLNDEAIILRTSFYKSKKKENEYAMVPFSADFYNGEAVIKTKKPSISFCGGLTHPLRQIALKKIYDCEDIESNFILRNGFWAPGVSKDVAIQEFNENVRNSLYGFCCRGAGNFSFRFGEVLSHGKIPVLIDSDCVLPFEHKIDWNQHAIVVPERDLDTITDVILDHYEKTSSSEIMDIQVRNRSLWKEYFTPLGFVKHLRDFIV